MIKNKPFSAIPCNDVIALFSDRLSAVFNVVESRRKSPSGMADENETGENNDVIVDLKLAEKKEKFDHYGDHC